MRLRMALLLMAAIGLTTASTAGASTTSYATGKPVCSSSPGTGGACFAIRRVTVTKRTAGARPFMLGDGATPSSATQGPKGGLTPSDLATAYNFTATSPVKQTIALVEVYDNPNLAADLATFDTQYSLPACTVASGCLTIVNQTGGTTLPENDPNEGWTVESDLDVQAAHSVCQTCKLLVVDADSDSDPTNLSIAENEAASLGATEISNSFGFPESEFTSADIAAFNHPGIVITASTGDDGWRDFDYLDEFGATYNVPDAPSTLSTVVAVGGTSLFLGQTAARQSETVWNDNGTKDFDQTLAGDALGATGGGCSALFSARPFQHDVAGYAATTCGSKRSAADVSAVGDYLTGFDTYHSYNCGSSCSPVGWETVGGTSLASPVVAAMWALAGGAAGESYPAVDLYSHLGGSSLYDVTAGGNGWCGGVGAAACGDPDPNTLGEGVLDCAFKTTGTSPSAGDTSCDAVPGYDGPSGVGTPNGLGSMQPAVLSASITGGPTTIAPATSGTFTATATDPSPGAVLSYTWNWGDGTANTTTTTGTATHSYAATGHYTITLTVSDSYHQSAPHATRAITVTS